MSTKFKSSGSVNNFEIFKVCDKNDLIVGDNLENFGDVEGRGAGLFGLLEGLTGKWWFKVDGIELIASVINFSTTEHPSESMTGKEKRRN